MVEHTSFKTSNQLARYTMNSRYVNISVMTAKTQKARETICSPWASHDTVTMLYLQTYHKKNKLPANNTETIT
jgi:hypothetical protein